MIQDYICPDCGSKEHKYTNKARPIFIDGQPIICKPCNFKRAGQKFKDRYKNGEYNNLKEKKQKQWQKQFSNQTGEERSEFGRKGGLGNRNNNGLSVKRQWETIRANPEQYEKAKKRLKQTALNFHASLSDEEKEQHYRKVLKRNGRSFAADAFLDEIEKLGIELEREKCINGFIVDALIKDTNIIIEFFGDTFHCNPKKYKNPDQYCSWISRTVGEQWARDRKRLAVFYKNSYKVVIVWQSEWDKSPNIVRDRIKNLK